MGLWSYASSATNGLWEETPGRTTAKPTWTIFYLFQRNAIRLPTAVHLLRLAHVPSVEGIKHCQQQIEYSNSPSEAHGGSIYPNMQGPSKTKTKTTAKPSDARILPYRSAKILSELLRT
jgi:hypothetical protein